MVKMTKNTNFIFSTVSLLIELAYTQLIICIVKSILELRYFPIML